MLWPTLIALVFNLSMRVESMYSTATNTISHALRDLYVTCKSNLLDVLTQ